MSIGVEWHGCIEWVRGCKTGWQGFFFYLGGSNLISCSTGGLSEKFGLIGQQKKIIYITYNIHIIYNI